MVDMLNKHTLLQPRKLSKWKSPWVTRDILQAIKRWNHLHNKFLKTRYEDSWRLHKKQRNLTIDFDPPRSNTSQIWSPIKHDQLPSGKHWNRLTLKTMQNYQLLSSATQRKQPTNSILLQVSKESFSQTDKGHFIKVIFMDPRKAFNSVDISKVLLFQTP